MRIAVVLAVLSATSTAAADPELRPQVQGDLGLSVIYAAYEHPVASHVSIAVGAGTFGTYFLPWFDRGQSVLGIGFGVRPTWFARPCGRGLYVAPYFRGVGVEDAAGKRGLGFTTGVFVGWTFGLTERLDLRVGAGAQYIKLLETSTPFVALDLVVGYRL